MPWSDDRQEEHSLQLVVERSAPHLAGYFDSPFWRHMVLQGSSNEPAIQHAIAAVAALHEKQLASSADSAESQDRRTKFALEQRNESIKHLTQDRQGKASKSDLRLLLTTSALFTCFAALQGHCKQAIMHATQGYGLMQQNALDNSNREWDVGGFAFELNRLVLILRRLHIQSEGIVGRECESTFDISSGEMEKPTKFDRIQEAADCLELGFSRLTMLFIDLELDGTYHDMVVTSAEKHVQFNPWLEAWERAYFNFLAMHQSELSLQDRKTVMVLKAHHLVAEMLSNVDLALGEVAWDAYHSTFEAIVHLAVEVLQGEEPGNGLVFEARRQAGGPIPSSSVRLGMDFGSSMVDPLYEVYARCRDAQLRRRALDLLGRHPRQECKWSSWTAWKVGRFLTREEEEPGSAYTTAVDMDGGSSLTGSRMDISGAPHARWTRPKMHVKRALPREHVSIVLNPGLFDGSEMRRRGPGLS